MRRQALPQVVGKSQVHRCCSRQRRAGQRRAMSCTVFSTLPSFLVSHQTTALPGSFSTSPLRYSRMLCSYSARAPRWPLPCARPRACPAVLRRDLAVRARLTLPLPGGISWRLPASWPARRPVHGGRARRCPGPVAVDFAGAPQNGVDGERGHVDQGPLQRSRCRRPEHRCGEKEVVILVPAWQQDVCDALFPVFQRQYGHMRDLGFRGSGFGQRGRACASTTAMVAGARVRTSAAHAGQWVNTIRPIVAARL